MPSMYMVRLRLLKSAQICWRSFFISVLLRLTLGTPTAMLNSFSLTASYNHTDGVFIIYPRKEAKEHCKIRIFLNFIYGIIFHPFKNIVPKVRKNYLLTTEIASWKLEIFHKRWKLTHFQNYKILFTNLWKIIPYFRNLFHAIPKIKKLFPSDTEENSIMQESVSQVFWLLKLTQLS